MKAFENFLLIENAVSFIPDVEIMSTLGTSTSRGNDGRIGQFGSGFPNSLALFARTYLDDGSRILDHVKICLGNDVYTFFVKGKECKDSTGGTYYQEKLYMKKQNGSTYDLNIDTNFGCVDWHDVTMGIREFISNACDGAESYNGTYNTVRIDKVPATGRMTRAKDGLIRVYIPLTDDIEEYAFDNLYKNFMCLKPSFDVNKTLIPNETEKTNIYRKGVLVGSYGYDSLFHYNINDIEINESRVVDSSRARDRAANALRDSSVTNIEKFIREVIINKGEYYESKFDTYELNPKYTYSESTNENWAQAFKNIFGDAVVTDNPVLAEMCRERGYNAVLVDSKYIHLLDNENIKTPTSVLNSDELNGRQVFPANDNVRFVFDKVCKVIENNDMTNGKERPNVQCFRQVTDSSGASLGFYDSGMVSIREDIINDKGIMLFQTMIEELSHHYSGSRDTSRDLQTYAFRLLAKMMGAK